MRLPFELQRCAAAALLILPGFAFGQIHAMLNYETKSPESLKVLKTPVPLMIEEVPCCSRNGLWMSNLGCRVPPRGRFIWPRRQRQSVGLLERHIKCIKGMHYREPS